MLKIIYFIELYNLLSEISAPHRKDTDTKHSLKSNASNTEFFYTTIKKT